MSDTQKQNASAPASSPAYRKSTNNTMVELTIHFATLTPHEVKALSKKTLDEICKEVNLLPQFKEEIATKPSIKKVLNRLELSYRTINRKSPGDGMTSTTRDKISRNSRAILRLHEALMRLDPQHFDVLAPTTLLALRKDAEIKGEMAERKA